MSLLLFQILYNGEYFEKSNYVSRKHAIFYIENGEVLIFDASTNGTFVNEKRLPILNSELIDKYNDFDTKKRRRQNFVANGKIISVGIPTKCIYK